MEGHGKNSLEGFPLKSESNPGAAKPFIMGPRKQRRRSEVSSEQPFSLPPVLAPPRERENAAANLPTALLTAWGVAQRSLQLTGWR